MIILEQWELSPFRRMTRTHERIMLDGKSTLVAKCERTPKSVAFYVNGKKVNVENVSPFTITQSNGDEHTPFNIDAGTYDIKVISYSESNEKGHVIGTLEQKITFGVPSQTSTILYDETFEHASLDNLLRSKYWVFAWENPDPKNVSHPSIAKRLKMQNGSLTLTCFAKDQDFTNQRLNPRTELRLEGLRLPVRQTYRVEIDMDGIAKDTFNFEFFQIMNPQPQSKPAFQLDFTNKAYNARYYDSRDGQLYRKSIAPFGIQRCKWQIDWHQSTIQKDCFIIVYLNGKEVWRRRELNIRGPSTYAWLQYGVYKAGNNNQDMWATFHRFTVKRV